MACLRAEWYPKKLPQMKGGEKKLNTKLYVGNLDYTVTGDQLAELFGQAGSIVSAVVISDKYSGRSKGFGFVEMSNEEEGKKAIEMFNGKDLQGRKIVVNEARPERPRTFQPQRAGFKQSR
jgi:RNA recognition motif-containing protein